MEGGKRKIEFLYGSAGPTCIAPNSGRSGFPSKQTKSRKAYGKQNKTDSDSDT